MPDFVLNRDHTLSTVFGHVLIFKKGQPTHIPPTCVKAAISIGADRCGGLPPEPDAAPHEVPIPDDRPAKIREAFKILETCGDRSVFNAAGAPSRAAITRVLGFPVDKSELESLWHEHLVVKGV